GVIVGAMAVAVVASLIKLRLDRIRGIPAEERARRIEEDGAEGRQVAWDAVTGRHKPGSPAERRVTVAPHSFDRAKRRYDAWGSSTTSPRAPGTTRAARTQTSRSRQSPWSSPVSASRSSRR